LRNTEHWHGQLVTIRPRGPLKRLFESWRFSFVPSSLTRVKLVNRPQKITFGEMHQMGVRGLLVYRSDYPSTAEGIKNDAGI
jgi:hypothetical protein